MINSYLNLSVTNLVDCIFAFVLGYCIAKIRGNKL